MKMVGLVMAALMALGGLAADREVAVRGANYDKAKIAPYTLEDPLTFLDGRKVTRESWSARRKEILAVFAKEMYGAEPPPPEAVVTELVDEKAEVLAGTAVRRQYRMWFKRDKSGPTVNWIVWIPRNAKGPVPIISFLNYQGNHELVPDADIPLPDVWLREQSDGSVENNRPVERRRGAWQDPNNRVAFPLGEILSRGYAVMSACYGEVSRDPWPPSSCDNTAYDRVFSLWGPRDPKRTDDITALGAWGWALSRGLDLAERIPEIDAKRSVVTGYSRLAKAALIAAARDERFTVCVPNQTGGGGVPLAKRDFGENVSTENRYFPHWYCRAYAKYAADPAKLLTFDQHLFLACIAPRALLVQGFDDPWYDTEGEYLAALAASPAWELLTGKGLPKVAWPDDFDMSAIGTRLGYVRRPGKHGLSAIDWKWLLDFADRALGRRVGSLRADTVLADGWTANGVTVTLPHTWNAIDSADGPAEGETDRGGSVRGSGYLRQAVTYRHALPAADATRRRFVRCEGASITAAVVVNGRLAGRHSGAMTAFAFEITKELRATNNVLEIVVDNYYDPDSTPLSGDFSMPGGLYRPVHLIETPAICLDPVGEGAGPGLEVVADPATGLVEVKPHVSYAVGTETNAVRLSYEVVETGFKTEEPSFAVEGCRPWTPEMPAVYHLRATLVSALGTDVVTLPFGFVRHELRADGYYLNGKKRKLRGVNVHQDVEGKGWALSPADEWQSIEMVKKMGADAVRTAHYPQSSGVYDLCDTRGLVAWIELPVVDEVGTNAAFRAHARQNLVEMIAQNRHHPSAAFWSIANEVQASRTEGGEPALLSVLAELRDTARAADATRPVVQANFEAGQTNVNALTGHFGLNTYPGWYWSTADRLQQNLDGFFSKNPKLTTIAVSEYGAGASLAQHENPAPLKCRDPNGGWHPEEYQTLHHVLQYAVIKKDPRIWGSFVWQMFDSAADVRTDGPVPGINDKGLVCRDHETPKDAFFFYKANWNPEPMLHLCGQRMTETTNAVAEVIAFSNCGRVTLKVNGRAVGTLEPDDVCCVRWPAVQLAPGPNEIRVEAGKSAETCTWNRSGR